MVGRSRFTRRQVLWSSIVGTFAALRLWPSGQASGASPPGEQVFHGLLPLTWGAAIPRRVRFPRSNVPSLDGPAPTAVYASLPAHTVPTTYHLPIYHLGQGTFGWRERPVQVLSHISGDLFAAFIVYDLDGAASAEEASSDPPLVITIMPRYPQPYPLWPGGNPDDGIVNVELASWLPRPGAALRAGDSVDAWWIDESTLFRLTYRAGGLESQGVGVSPEDVAAQLHKVTARRHP